MECSALTKKNVQFVFEKAAKVGREGGGGGGGGGWAVKGAKKG